MLVVGYHAFTISLVKIMGKCCATILDTLLKESKIDAVCLTDESDFFYRYALYIAKKLTLISLIVSAHYLDLAIGQNVFCLLLTYFMLGNEGLSIIENAAYCGVPVPATLKEKLEQLAREKQEAKQSVKDVGEAKDTAKK